MLVYAVDFHTERLVECGTIRHGVGRFRNGGEEEPEGKKEQMRRRIAILWQQEIDSLVPDQLLSNG